MRFVLHYRGPLRAAGDPAHKHELRQSFHRQLAILWRQRPLADATNLIGPRQDPPVQFSSLRSMPPFTFVPLATEELCVVAELDISMLRPGPPGMIVTQGGDIDNRLKTLFDALSLPPHTNSLPKGAEPQLEETPFFCLLEDDKLITSVGVRTDQLLERIDDPAEVD